MNMQVSEVFPCSKCGECCRHIDLVPELASFDRGDGVCIHMKDNLCDIYENRPDICCVDTMYEKQYSRLYSREIFYRMNLEACRELQKKLESDHT